jgi:hypothetical protein
MRGIRPSRRNLDNGFSSLRGGAMHAIHESKGMVKVWDHGDVPVAASQ